MISIFKIKVNEQFETSTRPNGVFARRYILEKINNYEKINLDFSDETPTPSFVDECIGQLITDMGWDSFKRHIQISNPNESTGTLIKHIMSRRLRSL